jgi:superfamily II DNA or RNA helicase/HKD family nuclease
VAGRGAAIFIYSCKDTHILGAPKKKDFSLSMTQPLPATPLPFGFYDRLVRKDEAGDIKALVNSNSALVSPASKAQRREHLLDELTARLADILDNISGQKSISEAEQAELKLIGGLLREARQTADDEIDNLPAEPLTVLRAIHAPDAIPTFPETGLRRPAIFTAARNDPSLLNELRSELACTDRVDILVSFITWSGVRKILDILKSTTALDATGNPRTRFRILTTTYIGATEARAVNALAQLPGVDVRISLDGRRNRLHAKAWMFHRLTGFGTAYVGSANLSEAALVGGIEWTVKFTQARDPDLYMAACANFEALWNDGEFQPYDPNDEPQRIALENALKEQRRKPGQSEQSSDPIALHTWFDLKPKPYQVEMLDRLASERRHGRMRNLIVAATGTGKTVVAAFDYERMSRSAGTPPRLLFIAHRIQILKQAMTTFRQVLRDPSFGELLDGDNEPTQYEHLFATITTVHRRALATKLGADYWHVVIVDEAHHLAAATFDQFIGSVTPAFLLGLTATPERADGKSLHPYFDCRHDGSPAVSLRLWDALDQQLLAPFEYYATTDETDLRSIKWNRPEELAQLDTLISSNTARSALVTNALQRYVSDLGQLKAVAFCVSVAHAEFMAAWFAKMGLPACSLTGKNTPQQRDSAIQDLRAGKIKLICTCDLFNEGVDIPEIDTLLLLRPTQSPVVFQQQIGRGLRLADKKESCLILDFVGLYDEEFRFDVLLRSITGQTRKQLKESVESGFGHLPAGCHIQFDRVSREQVLTSLRKSLELNAKRIRHELAAWASQRNGQPLTLSSFLRDNDFDITDLYTNSRSWTSYKRDINLPVAAPGPREDELTRRMQAILHVNDPSALQAWTTMLSTGEIDDRRVQMLAYQVLHRQDEYIDPTGFRELIRQHPAIQQEMLEIFDWLQEETFIDKIPIAGMPSDWPLTLHARYSRREILTAVGHLTDAKRPQFREGCLRLVDEQIELMFVTLDKREGFGDRVQYHDYAISPDRFHWQTQNMASTRNATGRRYIDSKTNGWTFQLFVREDADSAYIALGPVRLESHEGDRPISIVWALDTPMPVEVFRHFSVLRSA